MSASIVVEEEHGTFIRTPRRHNGYYAGDFSVYPADRPVPLFVAHVEARLPAQPLSHQAHGLRVPEGRKDPT